MIYFVRKIKIKKRNYENKPSTENIPEQSYVAYVLVNSSYSNKEKCNFAETNNHEHRW